MKQKTAIQELFDLKEEPSREVLSVTELARAINKLIKDGLARVWVEGELFNAKVAGHYGYTYFTLKDSGAQISGIMSAEIRRSLPKSVVFENGKQVRIRAELTYYEPGGRLQIKVLEVESVGLGDLMLRFEELKSKLQTEGLFDSERKLPLPCLPQRIGIITSSTGSVIHDIITVLQRRFPNLHLRLYPVKVQGAGAAAEIADAVRFFNRALDNPDDWHADVLIIGRGGGSLEDLWAFNEEESVRTVSESAIPIISAVGHQDDFSLCDFAADLRAATPSEAAEMVIRSKVEFENDIRKLERSLLQILTNRTTTLHAQLKAAAAVVSPRHPREVVERHKQQVDMLWMQIERLLNNSRENERNRVERLFNRLNTQQERKLRDIREKLKDTLQQLNYQMQQATQNRRNALELINRAIVMLNPLVILQRGYSITRKEDGTLLRSVSEIEPGLTIQTLLGDGKIISTVLNRMGEE